MKKTGFHALMLSLALMAGTSTAQSGLPARGPDYFRDAADLAGILGSAHAIRVRCNGRDDQYWRRYMTDMLAYEAPEPGELRASLVREFNDRFSDVSRDYLVCDTDAVAAESRYAERGQEIATRLATHYFPKRDRKGKGFE
ncbi:MAG: TIGR02301 family protein [Hyphomonas sp. 32-62-5]|nr:MAG: TIGR02301 family protein [Hyphomonas sp. 32-62-5]